MTKKSATKVARASAPRNLFQSAIQAGDLAAVRKLIADGAKPDGDAAEEAAEFCNEAHAVCHEKEKPLFGRMSIRKQTQKAVAESQAGFEMTKAILEAGAPVPNELCPAARCGNTKLALLLIKHGADVNFEPPMGTPLENA